MATMTYVEDFDDGPGGWAGHQKALEIENGVAISRSPWWVDPNHAPPGGGYLHLLFAQWMNPERAESNRPIAGDNRFIGCPVVLTDQPWIQAVQPKPRNGHLRNRFNFHRNRSSFSRPSYPKHLHHLVAEVVDDLDRDAA